ncbi:hypothetical protein BBJ28_00011400 [Nothophytophthora sp. Chile5]|nr:hypothetical protein BBJ28_00011400 [Nothophytophthora sp. Chile5]
MPQARVRGNSAVTAFKPKRWQLEEQCSICHAGFTYLRTRHHCRHCGLSVCGKHSKNKVVVPTSLSKVEQRVCDRCYPICQTTAVSAAASGGDAPPQRPRGRTMDVRVDRDQVHSMRSAGSSRGKLESRQGTGSTWSSRSDSVASSFTSTPHHVQSARERRMRSPHSSPGVPTARRRVASAADMLKKPHDMQSQMRSPLQSATVKRSSKHPSENPSTCLTEASSTTLSHIYADLNDAEVILPAHKPLPFRREDKRKSRRETRDSSYSIFSLASSRSGDDSDSDSDSISNSGGGVMRKGKTQRKTRGSRPSGATRPSLIEKEHLDFGASSSSVASFEMAVITEKYLQAMPEESESVANTAATAARTHARSQQVHMLDQRRGVAATHYSRHENKIRGAFPSSRAQLPPFRRARAQHKDALEGKTSSNDKQHPSEGAALSRDGQGSQNSAGSGNSDSEELNDRDARHSVNSDECFSDEETEALANLITASSRASRELTASNRTKKADSTGLDAAASAVSSGSDVSDSKAEFKAAPTTATYQLTDRDRAIMRQISELEARVLQQQQELPDLLDKYRDATKRAEQARKDVREAKARVHRYQKAHAAVTRAIRSGRSYMQQQEYLAAILELSRAAAVERSNATVWYMLAECRLKVGQPAAAEEACMTSLKLQPTGVGVALLGRILHERGRYDEAVDCYLSALGRDEEDEEQSE